MKKHRLISALNREPVDRTPVWIMRQAGRYLPEYRELRQQAGSFMNLCRNPELACEVTLQPLQRFALDAAIIFSDILTIPDAMGLGLEFIPGEGPQFTKPLCNRRDIERLAVPDPELELGYVMAAIKRTKQALNNSVPLIGFSGSPWTLATYMIKRQSTRDFNTIMAMIEQEPKLLHQLLATLTAAVTIYLQAQLAAGADVIMLFDTWGSLLTPQQYQTFSHSYLQQIITELNYPPSLLFTKSSGNYLEMLAQTGCSGISIDWTLDIAEARARVGDHVALQGNLDPAQLKQSPDTIRQAVHRILNRFGNHPGHIFNLGHGITPDISPDHVTVMVEAIQQFTHHKG
ncbi:MAG: uroporphyrinogen decarboxylase [Gammaproteobacteria bacterium]|nr:uroporphyrinogen decarboxylase [Gammaproteobacteria bacterium]